MEVENLRFVLARGWLSWLGWLIKHGSVKQSCRVSEFAGLPPVFFQTSGNCAGAVEEEFARRLGEM